MFEAHFQSFSEAADPSLGAERLAQVRAALAELKLDGFLVPRADRHQNEYVPAGEERLAWLTGFTGSAGLAIVLGDEAAIFVDGRYTLAVRGQVDIAVITPVALAQASPEAWLRQHVKAGQRIGYDPWLHTPGQVKKLAAALDASGANLVPIAANPIDIAWRDRPAAPGAPVTLHPPRFAGEAVKAKLRRVVTALEGKDGLLLSDPHAVAWLFNIRGSDVAHTPLPLCFALILRHEPSRLYCARQKLSDSVQAALAKVADIRDPDKLFADLQAAGSAGWRLALDAATVPAKLHDAFTASGGIAELGNDIVVAMKARKNKAELEGARNAQRRDGAAMVRFLAWFDEEAPKGTLTEIAAAQALETFRRETKKLKDVSFPSISAAGPNAAIPHYRVTEKSNRRIDKGIFLIDSGGQYEDGTTDITRTIAVGKPSAAMRDRFTRVLKGHIAIARAVFPKGTSGAQIDAFARQSLWEAGLDFDHGTGHGVGSYLSVHEGPQRISKVSTVALEPGMILSNEPGYYNAGQWGIRIENLVVVETREIEGAERDMLGFETITLAPIDRTLIEPKLLTISERRWLDRYHAWVRKELSPLVEPAARKWLAAATKALPG